MRQRLSLTVLSIAVAAALALPLMAADQAPPAPPLDTLAKPVTAAPATTTTAEPAKAAAAEPAKKAAAPGPIQIKVNDTINVRFGFLFQPQADFQQNAAGTGENLMLRRTRIMIGGQVAKSVFFFYQVENARLGAANAQGTKTMNTGFQTLDATAEWRPKKGFNLQGGLIRVPTSRDALESAASEFTLDFNTYAFTATTILGGMAGRDTGLMARGYFFNDRFEYRAVVVSGTRQPGSRNALRKVGRVQWNFFDKEVYNFPSYVGSNFGAKKILALGASYDTQIEYRGYTADLFADIPMKFGSAIGTATYQNLDGGHWLSGASQLPPGTITTVDGGFYLKNLKVGPWARYEARNFDTIANRDEHRALVGLNFYPFGNNFNIKAAVGRLTPAVGPSQNQYVIQLQAYYY